MKHLKRYPYRKNDFLQAWDAADELILEQFSEATAPELKSARTLILNDQFGALTCAFQNQDVTSYTDSYLSCKAIEQNTHGAVKPISHLSELSGKYDLVLIRIPKSMSFFEDLLFQLRAHLHENSRLICGYMIKHQANSSFELLEKYIGKTTTSLAKKKARLIFARLTQSTAHNMSQPPYPLRVQIEPFKTPFLNGSNIFSREKLDIGTRFFLEHIPKGAYKTILDLGCANGIVGIMAKKLNPEAKIIFSDESQMAVQCAKANYENVLETPQTSAEFHWANCYENAPHDSVDLVLCNPPFHQGNSLTDLTAKQMFMDSFAALRAGGILRVIGNQHLQYPTELKKIFGNSEVVAKNSKFMICQALRS
jgi:23S rRNA (guanine1835-N2)-methyltransferase